MYAFQFEKQWPIILYPVNDPKQLCGLWYLKLIFIFKLQWDKTSVFSLLTTVNSPSVLFNCFLWGLLWYQTSESYVVIYWY